MPESSPSLPMTPQRRTPRRLRRARRGFTLVEVSLALSVIVIGVIAMIEAQQSFIRSDIWSARATTAHFLAAEARELTAQLPRHDPVTGIEVTGVVVTGWGPEPDEVITTDLDDLDDFDGLVLSATGTPDPSNGNATGPVDAFGNVIPGLDANGMISTTAGVTEPMIGWSQRFIVEKVSPFDWTVVVADATDASGPPERSVSDYPLRITVEVWYDPPGPQAAERLARTSWVVPEGAGS